MKHHTYNARRIQRGIRVRIGAMLQNRPIRWDGAPAEGGYEGMADP